VSLHALAFVPSPPLLLSALGGGPEELRSACSQAISVLDGATQVVIVGAAPQDGWVTGTVDATPWGARGPSSPDPLPLSLAVGVTLLGDGRPYGVHRGGLPELPDGTGLLVVGDGTAKRTEKAPGHFDPRAEAFDLAVESALAAGDPAALLALDEALAEDLLVGGLAAWRAVARALQGSRWDGRVLLAQAPYGVGYVVASWTPQQP